MAEVASAEVALIPHMTGIEKLVKGEFGAAGAAGGKVMGSTLGGGLKTGLAAGVGMGLVSAAGKAIGAVGGMLTSGLKGGFERALNIEGAQAKLAGLGHDAKAVDAIMQNALASVKGTAFGLGDAATVAASTVAAGVKPGQDLERTLKLVGDAATIAGTDMSTMGSIINKVATADMMQMDVANQLMDAGIPILQMVGEEMGVTAEEARKLASEGKVSFETFQSAMESGLGGAAQKSGETFTGALANVRAAMSRIGEKFAAPVLDALRDSFNNAIPAIDALGDALTPVAERFGDFVGRVVPLVASALGAIPGLLSSAGSWFTPIIDGVRQMGDGLVEGFGGIDSLIRIFADSIPLILGPVGLLKDALLQLFGAGGIDWAGIGTTIGSGLAPVAEIFATLSTTIIGVLAPALATIIDIFTSQILPVAGQLAGAIMPVIAAVLPLIVDLIGQVGAVIVDTILPALSTLFEVISGVLMPIIEALMPFIQGVLTGIISAVSGALTLIQGVINTVMATITGDWTQAWEGVKQIVSGAWEAIKGIISAAWEAIKGIFSGLFAALISLATTGWNRIKTSFSTGVSAAVSLVSSLPGKAKSALSSLINALRSVATSAWNGLKSAFSSGISAAVSLARSLPGKVVGALGNLGSRLVASGRSLISGFTQGIREGFSKAISAVKSGVQRIRNFFPFSPAKEGPFSGRGYTTYSGRALMGDFAKAVRSEEGTVRAAIDSALGYQPRAFDVGAYRAAALPAGLLSAHAAPQIVFSPTYHYPVSEPSSVREKQLLDHAAALGVL